MKHHFILLSPFYSVILEYYVEHSCLLPGVYHGYQPNAEFIGSRKQCYEWIDKYLERLEEYSDE